MRKLTSHSRSLRLFLLLSLLLLLALFASNIAMQSIVETKYKELIYTSSEETLGHFSLRIGEAMNNVANGMVQYLYDSDIRAYVTNSFPTNDYTVRIRTRDKLSDISSYSSMVDSAYIYSFGRDEVLTNLGVWSGAKFYDPVWTEVERIKEQAVWTQVRSFYDPLQRKERRVVSVLRAIGSSNPAAGLLILNVSENAMQQIIQLPKETDSFTVLTNGQGGVLAVSGTESVDDRALSEMLAKVPQESEQGIFDLQLERVDYNVIFSRVQPNNWLLLHVVPVHSLLNNIRMVQRVLNIVFLAGLVLQLMIIAAMGKTVTMPFIRFANKATRLLGDEERVGTGHEAVYLDSALEKILKENQTLEQNYREYLKIASDRYLQRLLEQSESQSPGEIEENLRKYDLAWYSGPVLVAAVQIVHDDWRKAELYKLQYAQALAACLPGARLMTAHPSSSRLAVVLSFEPQERVSVEAIADVFARCMEPLRDTGASVTAGFGLLCDRLTGVSRAWSEATLALNNKYLHGDFVCYITHKDARTPPYPAKQAAAMIAAAKSRDIVGLRETLDQLLNDYRAIPDCTYAQMLDQLSQITVVTVRTMVQLWPELEKETDPSLLVYSEFNRQHYTLPQIRERLLQLFEGLFESSSRESKNLNQKIVEKAMALVQERYTEDLSLDEVCRVVCLSPQHFNKLFRKYAGTTFVDYLIHFRIGKACQMLQETNMKVKDISTQTGFNSQDYFTKAFRKEMGMSPLEYRKHSL